MDCRTGTPPIGVQRLGETIDAVHTTSALAEMIGAHAGGTEAVDSSCSGKSRRKYCNRSSRRETDGGNTGNLGALAVRGRQMARSFVL